MYKTLVIAVVVALSGVNQAAAQTKQQEAANNARAASVGQLIEKSASAQKIEASANPQAQGKREEARAFYRQAVDAINAGDLGRGNELLSKASKTMFEAVRMAGKNDVLQKKRERDYLNRLDAVNALVDTHSRISQDKGAPSEGGDLRKLVDNKLADAQRLREEKKLAEARKLVDEAYVAATMAIEQVRGGETLVRTLHFETKEEEYRYEVGRNDTHRILVDMLLQEKLQANASLQSIVKKFMEKAALTRATAEQQASSGDYETAVETMEQATKEIVRAIRMAGIYIPG